MMTSPAVATAEAPAAAAMTRSAPKHRATVSSGLDSIALAIAHLEQQKQQSPVSVSPPPPPPQCLAARTVSDDEQQPTPQQQPVLVYTGGEQSPVQQQQSWLCEQQPEAQPNPLAQHFVPTDPSFKDLPEHLSPTEASVVIRSLQHNDVLCGRGGESNHHTGNVSYRRLVAALRPSYLAARRREKPRLAAGIVRAVRSCGGRFLSKTGCGVWKDVGNVRAREKTSQALREGAPEWKQQQQQQQASRRSNSTGSTAATVVVPATVVVAMPPVVPPPASAVVIPVHRPHKRARSPTTAAAAAPPRIKLFKMRMDQELLSRQQQQQPGLLVPLNATRTT